MTTAAFRKRLEALEARMAQPSADGVRVVFRTMVGIDGVEDAAAWGYAPTEAQCRTTDGEAIEALYQRALDASPAGRVTGWRWMAGNRQGQAHD